MKLKSSQQEPKSQPLYSKFRMYAMQYANITVNSMLSFLIVGLGLYIVLIGVMKMSFVPVLLITFFISILINPFFSRIRLGEKIFLKYENWLEKTLSNKSIPKTTKTKHLKTHTHNK